MNIPETILAQLGGNKFCAMVGAKKLIGSQEERFLQFSIGQGAKSGINKVVVRLEAFDTYTVEFWKIGRRGLGCDMIESRSMIYCDQLQGVFRDVTGFDTHL